jgi:hypothetical protein
VQQGVALLGDPQLQGAGGGVDVPVAEGLGEQLAERRAAVVAGSQVAGVRLLLVVGRDLQPAAGFEVDVAQLDSAPGGLLTATAARGDRTNQRVDVQDGLADLLERHVEGLRHATQGVTTSKGALLAWGRRAVPPLLS